MNKIENEYVSYAYEQFDRKKAARMKLCTTYIAFNPPTATSDKTLKQANFCRCRLCPMCQWRRSLKAGGQLRAVVDEIKKDKPTMAYLFLTLTVKNVPGDKLRGTLDMLTKGFMRFSQYEQIEKAWKGYFRAVEVTHNTKTNEYHPHIHALIAVNTTYFKGNYIKHDDYIQYWKKACKLDYDPSVNIKRVKVSKEVVNGISESGAIAEVAKYAVKPSDILYYNDWHLTVDVLKTLDIALHKRRFISMGGIIKQYHKKLNLDDTENGNLVHITDKPTNENQGNELVYAWLSGYNQYVRV
jgi:plasmid rolling circle replication initiator protein Rep